MVAARLGCKRAVVGTELANSHPGCTNRPRNATLTVWGFNSGREGDVGSKCLSTEHADYCMLVEWKC